MAGYDPRGGLVVSSTTTAAIDTATTSTPPGDLLPLRRGMTTGVWRAVLRPAFPSSELHNLLAEGRTDAALDLVFDQLDDRLLQGRFAECAAILRTVDPSRLPAVVAAGFLAVTRAADDRLHDERRALRVRITEAFRETMPADALEELLAGL